METIRTELKTQMHEFANLPKYSRRSVGNTRRQRMELTAYFDSIATDYQKWSKKMWFYVQYTKRFLKAAIPENKSVLLIGGLSNEIFDALKPSRGVGLHFSEKLVEVLNNQNQNEKIDYYCSLPESFESVEKFDYVVILNTVDHSDDIFKLIDSLKRYSHKDTTVIISGLNPLWHRITSFASRLRIRIPDFRRNFVPSSTLKTALEAKSFKVQSVCHRILVPKFIPVVSWVCNQFLSRPSWNQCPLLYAVCFCEAWRTKRTF